jgi:hypothetical protein
VLVLCLVIGLAPAGLTELGEDENLARAEGAFTRAVQAGTSREAARRAFTEAADAFQELVRRGIRNPDLYRNLGNVSLLAGRLPEAVLAYRQGIRLAPGDRDLLRGLEAAREQVHYPSGYAGRPASSAWPQWLPRPSPGILLGLAIAGNALAWILATRWLMTRRAFLVVLAGASFGLTVVLAGLCALGQAEAAHDARHPVVVVAREGATLHVGNGPSYPPQDDLPILSRGMEGRQRLARGDWLQVDLPGGVTGWVRRSDVLMDLR